MKSHLETALTRLLKMEIKPATDAGRSLGGHGLGGGSWVGGVIAKVVSDHDSCIFCGKLLLLVNAAVKLQ